jgi:hypothetical protein
MSGSRRIVASLHEMLRGILDGAQSELSQMFVD